MLETAAVLGRRFDFDTLLDVTREPEDAAARRGGGAGQAPFAARGTRGRRIRLQPRQGARGGLSRHRRGAAQTAASVGGGSPGTPRRRRNARTRRPACGALRARPRLVEGAALPCPRRRAFADAVRDARCLALAGSRGRAVRVAPGVAGRASTPRDLRAARGGARAGRADARRGGRHSPRHRCGARRRRTRKDARRADPAGHGLSARGRLRRGDGVPHRSAGGIPRDERRAPRRRHPLSPRDGRVEHRAERPGDRIPPAGGRDLRARGISPISSRCRPTTAAARRTSRTRSPRRRSSATPGRWSLPAASATRATSPRT